MARLFTAFRRGDLAFAAGSAVCFVIALVTGLGVKALPFLGAALGWLLAGRYWAGKARAAERHRELRRQRLERERRGVAPPRG